MSLSLQDLFDVLDSLNNNNNNNNTSKKEIKTNNNDSSIAIVEPLFLNYKSRYY